jgi:phosphoenolpyruvate carboxylase
MSDDKKYALEALQAVLTDSSLDRMRNRNQIRNLTRALAFSMLQERGAIDSNLSVDKAQELIGLIYPPDVETDTKSALNKFMIAAANNVSSEQKEALVDFVARLGQLHQLAGLVSREHMLRDHPEKNGPLEKLFKKCLTAGDAMSALARPEMEFTFTAHPTNTNSVAFMSAQRQLAKALMDLREGRGELSSVQSALQTFSATTILPHRKAGKPEKLTVMGEIDTMLYFLDNAYEDMDALYGEYDAALRARYPSYQPEALQLKVKFHSWGSSGDKDGNGKVNANTTLLAVAKHRHAILEKYTAKLASLENRTTDLNRWLTMMDTTKKKLFDEIGSLETALYNNQIIPESEFDRISATLKQATETLEPKKFCAALEVAYGQIPSPQILSLLRKVRHFGFSMGGIEYRETAEEYERVVAALIPEYGVLYAPVQHAQEALTEVDEKDKVALKHAQEALEHARKAFAANGEERQRILQAAIEHPQELQQRVAELYERIAKDKAADKKSDKLDALPIAYHTLKRMELARNSPDMIANNVLAECQNTSNMLEALLLQHAVAKDGKRAMMGIVPLFEEHETLAKAPDVIRNAQANSAYKAHQAQLKIMGDGREIQQAQLAHSDNARRAGSIGSRAAIYEAQHTLKDMGVRRYQGGSQSDAYRDGVRSISGKISEFKLFDFAKMTFQGGDLLNYFNQPHSAVRLIGRNLAANALAIKDGRHQQPMMTDADRQVLQPLKNTIARYEPFFQNANFSKFLGAVGYHDLQRYGNWSSRAGGRGNSVLDDELAVKSRTIGFSETLQHAGMLPVFIGIEGLKNDLKDRNPAQLHTLYHDSSLFKDVIDRTLYSLSRTSFSQLQYMAAGQNEILQKVMRDYNEAYEIAMEAYTGKTLSDLPAVDARYASEPKESQRRHHVIQEVFPQSSKFFMDQDRLTRSMHGMRTLWLPPKGHDLMGSHLHNIGDSVHHGRNWLIDDPGAAKTYCELADIPRPYFYNPEQLQRG